MPHTARPQFAFLLLSLLSTLTAKEPETRSDRSVKPPTSSGQFSFSLLPNSLSKNAQVDMTVFGEVTAAGAAAPLPSAQSPVYYVAQSGGFRGSGGATQNKIAPDKESISTHVMKSLRVAGYLPADEKTQPSLLIVFHWGADYGHDYTSLLARATVIGGESFAKELADVMKEEREFQLTQSSSALQPGTGRSQASSNNQMPVGTRFASAPAAFGNPVNLAIAFRAFSPLERFIKKNDDNGTLLDQAEGGIYYVIVSAYDYAAALSKNQRVLLWRTRMTVDDSGVSFKDTLPALLANAGPYLGKDTGRAGTLAKKVLRSGTVEIGPSTVVETLPEKAAETSTADKP